jgi:putative FmdB family regulatory protein
MLYDYQCENCRHVLVDIYQRISEDPLVQCPACNKKALERIITGGSYAFVKGSNVKTNNAQVQEHAIQPDKPWYHKHGSASAQDINQMTKTQKAKYIMEGEK